MKTDYSGYTDSQLGKLLLDINRYEIELQREWAEVQTELTRRTEKKTGSTLSGTVKYFESITN